MMRVEITTESERKRKGAVKDRRKARDAARISSDHEISGTRHRQPHREKDIGLNWTKGKNGEIHAEPTRIQTGGGGYTISSDDWTRIFGTKAEKAALMRREAL